MKPLTKEDIELFGLKQGNDRLEVTFFSYSNVEGAMRLLIHEWAKEYGNDAICDTCYSLFIEKIEKCFPVFSQSQLSVKNVDCSKDNSPEVGDKSGIQLLIKLKELENEMCPIFEEGAILDYDDGHKLTLQEAIELSNNSVQRRIFKRVFEIVSQLQPNSAFGAKDNSPEVSDKADTPTYKYKKGGMGTMSLNEYRCKE